VAEGKILSRSLYGLFIGSCRTRRLFHTFVSLSALFLLSSPHCLLLCASQLPQAASPLRRTVDRRRIRAHMPSHRRSTHSSSSSSYIFPQRHQRPLLRFRKSFPATVSILPLYPRSLSHHSQVELTTSIPPLRAYALALGCVITDAFVDIMKIYAQFALYEEVLILLSTPARHSIVPCALVAEVSYH